MSTDDSSRRPPSPMGQKPRVPVGPRRGDTPVHGAPGSSGAPSSPPGSARGPTPVPASRPPSRAPTPVGTSPSHAAAAASRSSSASPSRRPPAGSPPPRRARTFTRAERIRRVLIISAVVVVAMAVLGVGALAGVIWHYGRNLPDVHNLRTQFNPPQTTRILGRDGTVLAELFVERRTVVPKERIPLNLVRAVLAAEDADFYRHRGLDYPGMVRALLVNIRRGTTAQGASTITQQVVKNVLLSSERSFARKVREVVLARRIEQELTKDEILMLYLNYIAFGHGRNGVEEAARFYFGKHVEQLTLGECVLIAGIPKSPTHYSPRNNPEAARRRRHWILGQMVQNQFVTQAEADAADAEPIRLAEQTDDAEGSAPEVVEAVRAVLRQTVGDAALREGGYTITTTIDPALERAARDAVQAGLRELDTRQGYVGPLLAPGVRRTRGRPGYVLPGEPPPADARLLPGRIYGGLVENVIDPDPARHVAGAIVVRVGEVTGRVPWASVARYVRAEATPSTFAPRGAIVRVSVDRAATRDTEAPMRLELGPQAALVAIDPATREVRALVGGYDAIAGMFDRGSRALRQAGSAFKPFLYSFALSSRRYTLASTVDPNPNPECQAQWHWCPRESHPRRAGDPPEPPMRLREALAFSRNLIAARVVLDVGPAALAEHAARVGITSRLDPTPSLALGTSDVTPLDLTNAYATWAAGGQYAPPTIIARVVGRDGREVPLPQQAPPRQAVSPEEAYLVTSMMTSVVDHGTGQRVRVLRRPVAGKTGTSNEARDAWFVGYTPELVAGVWVGFDDRQPLGRGEEGARSAAPIWLSFMRAFVNATHPPPAEFVRPAGVVAARIDPLSGLLARDDQADAFEEVFLAGTQPTQIAAPVSDAGAANFFTSFLTGGDGGIPLEAPEAPPGPPPSEPPLTLPIEGVDAGAPSVPPGQVPAPSAGPEGQPAPSPFAPTPQPAPGAAP